MDVEPSVGAALSRDLSSRSNWDADAEIDRFIQRRSVALKRENQQRREQEAWEESTRIHDEKHRQQVRAEWHLFHLDQAERHRRTLQQLIEHHESRAQQLSNQPKGAA